MRLDPENLGLLEQVREGFRLGHSLDTVAHGIGISARGFRYWIEKGEHEQQQGQEQGSHVPVLLALETGIAQFEEENLTSITEAARPTGGSKPQWQASAWLLERRLRNRWSLRPDTAPPVQVHVVTPSESLDPAAQLAVLEHMRGVALKKLEAGGGVVDSTATVLDEETDTEAQDGAGTTQA